MEDRCICCGKIVPEGMMVCPDCANKKKQQNIETGEYSQSIGTQATIMDKASTTSNT